MIYFAILDNEVLFEEINFHPVFSYGLMTYRNAYPQIKVFVDPKYDIELVKEDHDHVFPLNELKKEGKILELNNPLLAKRHLSGLIDKCFYFKVKTTKNFACGATFFLLLLLGPFLAKLLLPVLHTYMNFLPSH